jgi:hypothetical protein
VGGAHACRLTHVLVRQWRGGLGEDLLDALQARGLGSLLGWHWLGDGLQSQLRWVGSKSELEPVGALSSAMLDAEVQVRAIPAQIKIGVAPGMQFGRAAQRLRGRNWRVASSIGCLCLMWARVGRDGGLCRNMTRRSVRDGWLRHGGSGLRRVAA